MRILMVYGENSQCTPWIVHLHHKSSRRTPQLHHENSHRTPENSRAVGKERYARLMPIRVYRTIAERSGIFLSLPPVVGPSGPLVFHWVEIGQSWSMKCVLHYGVLWVSHGWLWALLVQFLSRIVLECPIFRFWIVHTVFPLVLMNNCP